MPSKHQNKKKIQSIRLIAKKVDIYGSGVITFAATLIIFTITHIHPFLPVTSTY